MIFNYPGTGLFVGSGSALAIGGPASLLIAFGLIGIMLYCTVHALGEMAVAFPVAGSFSAYSTRFIDPAWGFAMGWKLVPFIRADFRFYVADRIDMKVTLYNGLSYFHWR